MAAGTGNSSTGILSDDKSEQREQIIEMLTKAYWMEIETVMSYIANSINPDGVRAQEIIESLAAGHPGGARPRAAVRAAHQGALRRRARLAGLHAPSRPTSSRPSSRPTSSHVIKGVIEAETGAIEHYNKIIEATDGRRLGHAGHGDRRSSATRRATAACSRASCANTRPKASHRVGAVGGEPAARLDSLDYGQTLSAVARLAVPEYADWCFVELLTETGGSTARDGARRPVQARVHRGVDRRYPLDRDGRWLAARDPHRRAGADERDPGRVLAGGRPGSRAPPAAAGGRHRLRARRPHARARDRDRRHRARAQRLRAPLHRTGPAAGAGPGRPLRAAITTRACTPPPGARATTSRRSSRAWPTR